MAFAFDEYPTPELPGAFIFDDIEKNNNLGFDPPTLDPKILKEPSLTQSESSTYGCGDWETLTPEEVLESQVNVKPKTYVQDTVLRDSEGSTHSAVVPGDANHIGLPEKRTLVGMESTWDLSMNPVKPRKNRPKTKKQRAAASFVRKYGACSVHKKAKKSCACNLPAILRSVETTPQTADIDTRNMAIASVTPESMASSSPNRVSEQGTTQAADPHSHSHGHNHPSHLRKILLIQRVLSMLLLALNALPADEHAANSAQPDTGSALSLIQQSAAAMGLPPGTFSHLESIAQSALTNSLVYFCPYVFTGCSFSTSDLDLFSLHTSNHPLDFVLVWDLFSLPSQYPTGSPFVFRGQLSEHTGIGYQRDQRAFYGGLDDTPSHDEVPAAPSESLEPAQSPLTCDLPPHLLPNVSTPPLLQNYHDLYRSSRPLLRVASLSSIHQQPTNPHNAQPIQSLLYHPLLLLLNSLIWDTLISFAIIAPFYVVFSAIAHRLSII